jgi:DNA-binding helix-hairpin-helix protein with protein kinase domain
MKDRQYILGFRHPDNPYGQGSPEFWKAEYGLYDCTREEYHSYRKEHLPKCPYCGIPQGYAPGTGDCGCEVDRE